MAKFIEHRKLRPGGPQIFDPSVVSRTHDGWRRVSTIPMPHESGKLIVWFVDGGAAIREPGYRWPTR